MKYDYIDCRIDNLVGYSTEYMYDVMTEKTYRKCIAKAVMECDEETLIYIAKRLEGFP